VTWRLALGIAACILFTALWIYAIAYQMGAPS
jgi:hypothetical protein